MDKIAQIIAEFGFPVAMALGMGYFIYFTWKFITVEVKPALGRMFASSIKLTDQLRMLDQDMIRLQQKINVVLEYRERQKLIEDQANLLNLEQKEKDERRKKNKE
ncbi:MAG: hypothetical protein CMN93_07255 [Synechococcus sp. CPC35]|jgi:hypothetical protein|nr:hypothetical protein [Synechococcus sp. CPC35]